MKIILLILTAIFLSSCATGVSDSGLYWGYYSSTSYQYKKNPSKENLLNHKNELLSIIAKSKELNLRVPPGVQAELGIIFMDENDSKLALENFIGEKTTYSESELLMTRLLDLGKKKKGNK
jgi:hypothetical protein